MIETGERVPEVALFEMTADGPAKVSSGEVFTGKRVALFGVPGAFTPTCHNKHMPSFVNNMAALKAKGVDAVVCVAVNDPFVMGRWGDASGATAAGIRMLGDPEAALARAMGLDFDGSAVGLGTRIRRFAALVEDGRLAVLKVEENPGEAAVTTAESLMAEI